MALSQASSIFWNGLTAGLSVEATAGWAGAGAEEGFCAATKQQENRKTKKPKARRGIRTIISTSGVRGQSMRFRSNSRKNWSLTPITSMIALGLGGQGLESVKKSGKPLNRSILRTSIPIVAKQAAEKVQKMGEIPEKYP